MSIRTVLANLAAGNQALSILDNLFSDVWNAATMSCTAAGTNAITLTARTNVNSPAAYVANQRFAFDAAATSTGNVTVQVGSLAALNLYQPGGSQAGSGTLTSGTYYEIAYDPTLNAGVGGFMIMNSTLPSVANPLQASFKNLVITNTTSAQPNSQVTATADQLVLWNASNGAVTLTSYAPPVTNILVNGANGLDTGSVASGTWYAWWAIYNPTSATAAGLLSTSFTAPTMPAGYTYKARLGAFLTDTTPNLHRILQKGRRAQYVVSASVTTFLPLIASGVQGTYSETAPAWASGSLTGFVPTAVASEITCVSDNIYNNGTLSKYQVAPNANYAGPASTAPANPPPLHESGAVNDTKVFSLELESTKIFFASNASGFGLCVLGWCDNIN